MIVSQTRFKLFAMWILILACQYYFLYKKFENLSVCHAQMDRTEALQAKIDKIDKNEALIRTQNEALIKGMKK
jgi:hypothetical protein